jgi:secreted PhoX family phosphatase
MTELTDRPVDLDPDFDADDLSSNPSTAPHFADVVASRMSRRTVLRGGMLAAAGFMTTRLVADTPAAYAAPKGKPGKPVPAPAGGGLLGFQAIPLSSADEVVVPAGYTAVPFIPWGTPLRPNGPAFVPGTPPLVPGGNTAAEQEQQVGMHHDGMHYFPFGRGGDVNRRGLLVVNHEYTDEGYLHNGTTTEPAPGDYTLEMVRKSQAAHGVSVLEVRESRRGKWKVMPSKLNRRITANTPMTFSGAAAASPLLDTGSPADGQNPVGTINNCAHGFTPWGTYLACEENFNGYFAIASGTFSQEDTALQKRYGVGRDRFNWATNDPRFVVTPTQPNEPNRFGWVVEIDPFDASSTPVKRTALGRLKHEGAFVHVAGDGRVVVYMGDDQTNDYAYKFVSARPWSQMVAAGQSPLDEGTLYVARFNDDGSGTWMALVHGEGPLTAANGFDDQADVLVKTRLAADALGATRMDRPEWTTVDQTTGMVYLTLTNNRSDSKEINAANPRKPNPWGHIIRWAEAGNDHTATSFQWDLFLLAGPGGGVDGSTIDAEDAFGSPDGLWADPDGRVWIQTDGRQPGGANDQMLAADPKNLDAQGRPELRRFFTGVVNCEVTGVITTPDQRTMFVNLQHPGEGGGSTWPQNDGLAIPRSATVIITKDDGGVIGT